MPTAEAEKTAQPSPSVARQAGVVGLAVIASRVLGLVRDQVFAAFFGAGLQYDAFLTAFRIPNLLRDLLAEGALSAAFVTTFSQVLEAKGKDEAARLANRVATAMVLIIAVISILAWFFASSIVFWIAPGFFDVPGKGDLTIHLTRVMIPFLLLVALAAQAMGVLNANNRFGIPSLASAFFNIGSIAGGLLLGFLLAQPLGITAIEGMAYGTLIGGFLQFAVQWPSLRRLGYRYRPMFSFSDPALRQIAMLMGPAIIGVAAVQINVFVNTNFASAIVDTTTAKVLNGPVSWLNYAFRFMQFPIGVFGVAIATATLPAIARSAARQDIVEFRRTLAHSLVLTFLLCIPSAIGLIVLGRPIVALIFEHGKFTGYDTIQTADALAAYSIGLAGYAAVKVLSPAFYALKDARTPMLVSLGSIVVNYLMNSMLVRRYGHVGLAMSTSIVALVNFALLMILMRRKLGRIGGRHLSQTFGKICLASFVMAIAVWLVNWQVGVQLPLKGTLLRLVQVPSAIAAGALSFYFLCRMLRVQELDEAIGSLGGRLLNRRRSR
ncbi:MAG: murein biosynthesis integral membrane protein MurJ [Deltaproteobacteria bacterium]|nr:murein biosynthesis integral membrane protein MurJ [Deltaproteobacteria bacterium]